MNKNDILDYVMNTPGNTNRAVLNSMLSSFEGSEGGSMPDGPTFDDGKTRLFITIPDLARSDMTISIGCTVAGGVTIDWGDGSETEVTTSTARTGYSHEYSAVGDYVISLEVTDGELVLEGNTEEEIGIGGAAAYNSARIRKVEIGDGVTSIGEFAFTGCFSLTSVVIPEGVTSIGEYAFDNCYALTSVTIPSSVTSIGADAFGECTTLTSVTIPSSVTSIGEYAFSNCITLTSVTIHSSVTSIGDRAFTNCFSLTSITIPSSVTSIGDAAFSSCVGMAAYYFEPLVPPTITATTFSELPKGCKIYVPTDSFDDYASAPNWNQLISYLVNDEGVGATII